MRKRGIVPLSVFRIYYKVLSKYSSTPYYYQLSQKAKEIKKSIEISIEKFLTKHQYNTFNDSLTEIENYFEFCISKNYEIYFHNLDLYIEKWKKSNICESSEEIKYVFASKIQHFLKIHNISFKDYIKKHEKYIPPILQHYIASYEIPFEVILYLKILDKCDIDKKKLRMLLHKEFTEMSEYNRRLKKLKPLIESELRRVLLWEKTR